MVAWAGPSSRRTEAEAVELARPGPILPGPGGPALSHLDFRLCTLSVRPQAVVLCLSVKKVVEQTAT
jgi:hypothetical protein